MPFFGNSTMSMSVSALIMSAEQLHYDSIFVMTKLTKLANFQP